MINSLDRLFATRRYDLTVVFATMYPFERLERAALNTPGVRAAEGWITTEGALATTDAPSAGSSVSGGGHGGGAGQGSSHGSGAQGRRSFAVIALPPGTNLHKPDILEGRGLQPGDTDAVVINTALAAAEPQLKVGVVVPLLVGGEQSSWRIVGIAHEPFSPAVAYLPREHFDQRGQPGLTNNLRLTLDKTDRDSVNQLKTDLDRNLEQAGVRVQNSASKADGRYSFDQHMLMIYAFLLIVSGVLGLVGGLGLMTTMSLNVLERRREMGVLRAVGATPAAVWLIVVAEGVVIGVLSWVLAVLLAWPVGKTLGDFLVNLMLRSGLDFLFEPRALLIWLVVSVLWGAVASFLPAWHASRRPVREAIGYE